MDIAKVLAALNENAVKAVLRQREMQELPVKVRGQRVYFDGQGVVTVEEPCRHPLRDHTLDTIEDLCALARDTEAMPGRREVWHDHAKVVLRSIQSPAESEIERGTLTLQVADRFRTLSGASNQLFDQRELVRLFKYKLVDGVDPTLLAIVRSLNFVANDQVANQLESQRESLGRSIERQVSGVADLPEMFPVTTQVYQNAVVDFTAVVRCSLEPDFEQRKFRFSIFGDDLADAIREAQRVLSERIGELIGDESVAVYAGKP